MPANTDIKVCNRALKLMGAQGTLSSFADGTVEADVCDAVYEDIVRAALTEMPWRFAVTQVALNRDVAEPAGRWDAAYEIPSGALRIVAVTINDNRIEYDRYGDKIFCNASSGDTVVMDYVQRVQEALWPSWFTMVVLYLMASELAVAIARDNGMADLLSRKAQFYLRKARHIDSVGQTTRKIGTTRFIAERR